MLLAASVVCPRAGAQSFGLSVAPSANALLVSNSVTYTINATNLTGISLTTDVWMTNSFSAPFQYVTASTSQPAGVTNDATNVIFDLGPVDVGGIVQVSLTVQPSAAGSFTNSVVVSVPGTIYTASTNAIIQVTNMVIEADLGVTMIGSKQVVITNDWMTYGITVTNSGPNTASGVTLSNIVPPGVIGISSPNGNSGTHPIPLGTLISGGSTNLFFLVEPTNIATVSFSASVGSGTPDTNTANNFASTNVTVTNYLSGTLVVVTNSPQIINFQNALTEQSITLSNAGPSSVPAARIIVTGVTNELFNGVGTNNGNPFVYYSAPLVAGQSVSLLLQYYPRGYFPFTNSQLSAFAVPLPDWTPPPISTASTNLSISRIVQLANGNMLIEWPSTLGKTYTVVYSDNVSFSNAMIAPPSIVAPANRTQWTDYGPPTTTNSPVGTSTRFYRVYQNP